MQRAVLVAPFFLPNTLRYVRALTEVPGLTPALITQDDPQRLPADLRHRVADIVQVRDALDGDNLAQACRTLHQRLGPIDALLGALEQLQGPLAHARAACGIPGMRPDVALRFRDKDAMKTALRDAGIPCARHRLVQSEGDALAFVAEVGLPIIVKPVQGVGSRGTYRIRSDEELRQALAALEPSAAQPLQAEEFVSGRENTFETVSIAGQPVWHSGTHYLPGPLEVLENPWMQYCVLLPKEEDLPEFEAFAPTNADALRALGMETGLSHMEWFLRPDGTHCVSEVGARPPGVHIMPMMSHVNDVDFVQLWVRLMTLGTWPQLRRKRAAGVAFLRGQGSGARVRTVHGLAAAQEEVGSYIVDRELPAPGQPRVQGYEGQGWALLVADDTATVRHALQRLVTLVQVEMG